MSDTASGAPRQYNKKNYHAESDTALREAKGGKRKLTEVEQLEHRIAGLTEQLIAERDKHAGQLSRAEEIFRNSEAMRNRQVDIINRLNGGQPMGEIMDMYVREIANQDVRIMDLEARVRDLHTKLYGAPPSKEKSA